MDHKSLVFASVFPVPSISHTTPTPIATPDLGFTAPGQSFGGALSSNNAGQHREVKRNLAWSTATRFLSLPKAAYGEHAQFATTGYGRPWKGTDVTEALEYLLAGDGRSADDKEDGLIDWYTNEVRIHFVSYVHPALRSIWDTEVECQKAWSALAETQQILQQFQRLCLQPFNDHILPVLQQDNTKTTSANTQTRGTTQVQPSFASWKFQRNLHALFVHSLPSQRFSKTLSYVLYNSGCRLFRIYVDKGNAIPGDETIENIPVLRTAIMQLLRGLHEVGLGGEQAQKAFAHAMDKLMGSFIVSHYMKVDWYARKSVIAHLRQWVKDGFSTLVRQVMDCLKEESSSLHAIELQQWQDMAIGRLGRSRVENLFDFVINWDRSLGAILDIKEFLKTPAAKAHLSTSFSQQVSRRLLHPGATTTYILNVYIHIIRAFNELEPKGVLLERVARPVRRYLKERDDTARIIISSLLADIHDEHGNKFVTSGELSYEIAAEMQKPIPTFSQDQDDDLNWNDMNWQPHPTDASPDYKKSKVEDVIWFLLTLYDREDFINELKNILGDHLLRNQDPEYEKEIRLLELIKLRLGDDKLQACEVMLSDVLDSKRINASIREDKIGPAIPPPLPSPHTPENIPRTPQPRRPVPAAASLKPPSTPTVQEPPSHILNVQILSSFFWPALREDTFLVPAPIHAMQRAYEARFERVKGMRKLRWLPALGRVKVELQLDDRTVEADVQTWQASVVYAFQPQPGEEWVGRGKGKGKASGEGITRNVAQLVLMLEMDELLVRNALGFWVGQSVLKETGTDTFTVLESLALETAASAAAAQDAAEVMQAESVQASAVVSQSDLLMQNKELYRQFILGMLTNQGNMPTQRILMMLKMAVPGGFAGGVDELRGLLGELVGEGRLGVVGEVYGVRKG
ncbi:hypothetical protein K432DRAFT_400755 [Lepidopterella palustris CBS 459.81]|uniref:Anaphase-promoting complex subunit 2 n=1 Tax=Lepidopterella palustris CBS 459.81 TaxID=1314670 RepID=A0A8E2JJN4_9PEZI|nr:hypothetical protein K432DRAFT_400755 [Lepidopterella palustris CBS 459.81]